MKPRKKKGWISPIVLTASLVSVLTVAYAGQWWWPALRLPSGDAFILWLCLLLVAGTATTILWASIAARAAGAISSRRFLGYALVTDCSGVLLIMIGVCGGHLRMVEALRVYLVLVTWLGLWTSMAVTLRTAGSVFATVATLSVAFCCFGAPLLALPLGRAVADSIPGSERSVLEVVATATPMLAVADAVRADVPIHWTELADTYLRLPADQSFPHLPTPTPKWWISSLVYGAIAGFFWLLRRPWRSHA